MEMRYSSQIQIISLTALTVAVGYFIYACTEFSSHYSTALIFAVIAFLIACFGIIASNYGSRNLGKNVKRFRTKLIYCYSCGTLLKEALTAATCPKCQSKLNLLEIIDIE